jgi:hypothetical protein
MTEDQRRKVEVLKFRDLLKPAGIANVSVRYHGEGDEGIAEAPELQDATRNPVDESTLPSDLDCSKLGDILEGFASEGYEDGEGGHGTITFNVETQKILVEHNWYETISNPDEPREI